MSETQRAYIVAELRKNAACEVMEAEGIPPTPTRAGVVMTEAADYLDSLPAPSPSAGAAVREDTLKHLHAAIDWAYAASESFGAKHPEAQKAGLHAFVDALAAPPVVEAQAGMDALRANVEAMRVTEAGLAPKADWWRAVQDAHNRVVDAVLKLLAASRTLEPNGNAECAKCGDAVCRGVTLVTVCKDCFASRAAPSGTSTQEAERIRLGVEHLASGKYDPNNPRDAGWLDAITAVLRLLDATPAPEPSAPVIRATDEHPAVYREGSRLVAGKKYDEALSRAAPSGGEVTEVERGRLYRMRGDNNEATLSAIIDDDGDVHFGISVEDKETVTLEFCTMRGGGRNPDLTAAARTFVGAIATAALRQTQGGA